jgi:hypothetical protein
LPNIKLRVLIAIALPLITSCSSLSLKPAPSCKIVNYGLVSARDLIEIKDDANAFSGKRRRYSSIDIYETTERVPVRGGIGFGVEHVFENIPTNKKIKLVLYHPKMVKPSGEETSMQVFEKVPDDGTSYGFHHQYEEVEGPWRFEFWYSGDLLCAKDFVAYK